MAEIQSWQRQSFAKNASTGPSKMNGKIAGNSTSFHSKIAKPTVHNYADGGEVNANPYQGDDVDPFSAVRAEDGSIEKGVETVPVAEPKVEVAEKKPQSFKEAFAENRKAGNATFEWNGKKFTTEVATGKQAPRIASKPLAPIMSKTFSEDVAERKKSLSAEKAVERAMTRDENYSNEGRRSVQAPRAAGRGVIDTSNIDSKTLLPKR
jgi:hypothetical protein